MKNVNNDIQGGNCILETPYRERIVFGFHDPTYYTTSDSLGPGKNGTSYREATVLWKRHTGRPLCVDPMIPNLILPQIGLLKKNNNAIQEGTCILETPYRETIVFYYMIHKRDSYSIPTVNKVANQCSTNARATDSGSCSPLNCIELDLDGKGS